ncbi:hypothetical protein Hypma_008184 [Hypsizygus marmoreus]|uniref:Uncharacterized protein n=1 Tax=Hypsizygus marmoreus TaxID=39966 RepID=A0A369JTU3_HYPMA|nr:hypothetical protein Hypma_008184 [Hypsizygus marmoreus]
MSSQSTPSAPLQAYHVRNLILILQRANAHYTHVAARIRASFQPTHHARKRAARIGLTVDIRKAVACEQRQVSVVPLPILDTTPSPVSEVASIRIQSQELSAIDGRVPLQRRPALKCAIPKPAALTRTSPNGTTSALSSSSAYSSISLSSAAAVLSSKLVIPSLRSHWSPADKEQHQLMDVTMTHEEAISVPANSALQQWQPLDVPIDEEEMDWGVVLSEPVPADDEMSTDTTPSSSAGSGSNSDSTTSSAGPVTPFSNQESLPLMIRIKRKSVEVSGTIANDESFEKRPRFDRNEWEQPAQRRNVIRIPARR